MEKQSTFGKGNRFYAIAVICFMFLGTMFSGISTANATCTTPTGLSITEITGSAATLSWTTNGLVTRFEIQTRDSAAGTNAWITARTNLSGSATSYRVGSDLALAPNKTYQVRMRAICSDGSTTAYASTPLFRTTSSAACGFPYNLAVSAVTSIGATFMWESSTDNLISYEIRYRIVGGSWFSSGLLAPQASYSIRRTNLTANQTYQWLVVGTCSNGDKISVDGARFTTPLEPYCSAPTNLSVSNITNVGATFNWEATTNTSKHRIYIRRANTTAWILAGSTTDGNATSFRYGDMIPNETYSWYMQTNCDNGDLPPNKYFGPDFTVNGAATCNSPSNLNVYNISQSGANFSWSGSDVPAIMYYEIEVRKVAQGSPIVFINFSKSLVISTAVFEPNTQYNWKVRTYCANKDRQPWVIGATFTTNCNSPSALSISNIIRTGGTARATFNWVGGSNIQHFDLQYKRTISNNWISISNIDSSSSSLTRNGLQGGTTYMWRMRSTCTDNDVNEWVNGPIFNTTSGGRLASEESWATNLRLYPNPSSGGAVNVAFDGSVEETLNVSVHNTLGQQVAVQSITPDTYTDGIPMDFSHLSAGMYIVKISDGTHTVARQLVIENK